MTRAQALALKVDARLKWHPVGYNPQYGRIESPPTRTLKCVVAFDNGTIALVRADDMSDYHATEQEEPCRE